MSLNQKESNDASVHTSDAKKRSFSRLIWAIPLLVVVALVVMFYSRIGDDTHITPNQMLNTQVPTFALTQLSKPEITLTQNDLPTKPYLLNVWATWCPSCMAEHAFFVSLAEQGITVVGVNYNDDRQMATDFLRVNGNPFMFSIFDDNGSMAVSLGLTGAPETFLVDGKGNIRKHIVGVVNLQKWQQELQPCWNALNNPTASQNIENTCA